MGGAVVVDWGVQERCQFCAADGVWELARCAGATITCVILSQPRNRDVESTLEAVHARGGPPRDGKQGLGRAVCSERDAPDKRLRPPREKRVGSPAGKSKGSGPGQKGPGHRILICSTRLTGKSPRR